MFVVDPEDDAEELADALTEQGYHHGSTTAVQVSFGGRDFTRIIVTMVLDVDVP